MSGICSPRQTEHDGRLCTGNNEPLVEVWSSSAGEKWVRHQAVIDQRQVRNTAGGLVQRACICSFPQLLPVKAPWRASCVTFTTTLPRLRPLATYACASAICSKS